MVYLKANSVLAVVLLAWRSLWVELSDHGLNLAIVSGELRGTPTRVLIDPVHADATVLPQVVQVWSLLTRYCQQNQGMGIKMQGLKY